MNHNVGSVEHYRCAVPCVGAAEDARADLYGHGGIPARLPALAFLWLPTRVRRKARLPPGRNGTERQMNAHISDVDV